jgi:hypothetical protein
LNALAVRDSEALIAGMYVERAPMPPAAVLPMAGLLVA